jgi:hypothetical protein
MYVEYYRENCDREKKKQSSEFDGYTRFQPPDYEKVVPSVDWWLPTAAAGVAPGQSMWSLWWTKRH